MVAQWLWQTKSVCSQGKKARNSKGYVANDNQPIIIFCFTYVLVWKLRTVQLISIDFIYSGIKLGIQILHYSLVILTQL